MPELIPASDEPWIEHGELHVDELEAELYVRDMLGLKKTLTKATAEDAELEGEGQVVAQAEPNNAASEEETTDNQKDA